VAVGEDGTQHGQKKYTWALGASRGPGPYDEGLIAGSLSEPIAWKAQRERARSGAHSFVEFDQHAVANP
jgi:hypothetical protein